VISAVTSIGDAITVCIEGGKPRNDDFDFDLEQSHPVRLCLYREADLSRLFPPHRIKRLVSLGIGRSIIFRLLWNRGAA
jgi:hypothetical protein